jgi:anti-sigma factor RsiW
MKCDHAAPLVAAYADGELEGMRRHSVEKHLRACAHCAAAHADILALRMRLHSDVPYFAAPPGLQERVRAIVEAMPPARFADAPAPERWRWISGGAFAGCAATVLAFIVGTAVIDWRDGQDLAAQAVASHVRATLGHHLIEVASSDRHTVKPWLSERLDYSPPVRDLAPDGFPLLGGRLTRLEGQPIATLVYGYRKHTIDVFVRPEALDAPPLRDLRGFNVAHARGAGFDWLAVSDAGPDVLNAFLQQLLREAAKP